MGGFVIRDGALPSLLGRYVYADTYDALGGELSTAQSFSPVRPSGDSGLGLCIRHPVVSFGEDACGHIYVASLGGTVYGLEPTSGPFPCIPQIPPPPLASAAPPASGFDQKAAIKKCKKKHPKGSKKRKKCIKKAKKRGKAEAAGLPE